MAVRVYVLLNAMNGKSDQVAGALLSKPGVIMVDVLDGTPNVIMVVQERERETLARLTIQALASIETLTDDIQLLPTRDSRCGTHLATQKPLPDRG